MSTITQTTGNLRLIQSPVKITSTIHRLIERARGINAKAEDIEHLARAVKTLAETTAYLQAADIEFE